VCERSFCLFVIFLWVSYNINGDANVWPIASLQANSRVKFAAWPTGGGHLTPTNFHLQDPSELSHDDSAIYVDILYCCYYFFIRPGENPWWHKN